MEIGKIINKRRLELGLTLEDVGNAVGVSKSTVKKWEDGFISNMKRDKIAALANILQISPVSLITGDEKSAPAENGESEKIKKIKEIMEKASQLDDSDLIQLDSFVNFLVAQSEVDTKE